MLVLWHPAGLEKSTGLMQLDLPFSESDISWNQWGRENLH